MSIARALQRAHLIALLDRPRELPQDLVRAAALLEGHGHGFSLHEEDRVESVDGARPALGREVERQLLADGEVELALERVEEEVDLVHDEAARAEEAEHLRERAAWSRAARLGSTGTILYQQGFFSRLVPYRTTGS